MRRRLLDILVCPACRFRPLEASSHFDLCGDSITHGDLLCSKCKTRFPIINGVPCLLIGKESKQTREGFTGQWRFRLQKRFETKSIFGIDAERQARWIFDRGLESPQSATWILDAGSGSGEIAVAVARQNPNIQVIALDFNDTVLQAKKEDCSNLHFVQGDVSNPPLQGSSLDGAYSIGVLHHTPNTEEAFKAIAKLVDKGGNLCIWLYPDPSEDEFFKKYYRVRDLHFGGIGHRLPAFLRLVLVRLYVLIFAPFIAYECKRYCEKRFKGKYDVAPPKMSVWDGYKSACFLLFDNLTPRYQFRHSREEVREWFIEAAFHSVETDNYGTYWGTCSASECREIANE